MVSHSHTMQCVTAAMPVFLQPFLAIFDLVSKHLAASRYMCLCVCVASHHATGSLRLRHTCSFTFPIFIAIGKNATYNFHAMHIVMRFGCVLAHTHTTETNVRAKRKMAKVFSVCFSECLSGQNDSDLMQHTPEINTKTEKNARDRKIMHPKKEEATHTKNGNSENESVL